ncbi:PHP domain-containing protein [Methanocella sp. MCL-LM]|uniref:PHP domain-containing protein n=1 Tax=Methanocella sp. MCL-LM TaxID=3412035 RepID=UPI003C71FC2A
MLKYDLHSHSRYSKDGIMDVRDLLKIAKKRGLDGIAITDHDTIRGGMEAVKLKPEGIDVICGCEVNTDRGDVIGLFLTEEIKAREHTAVIEEIKAQGGVAIVPHPFDSMRGSAFWLKECDAPLIDGVEVINARCVFNRYNDAADTYSDTYGKAKTGGSDAHFGAEIGNAYTLLEEGSDLREAILKRQTVAFGRCSSPVFHVRTTALLVQRRISRRKIKS